MYYAVRTFRTIQITIRNLVGYKYSNETWGRNIIFRHVP